MSEPARRIRTGDSPPGQMLDPPTQTDLRTPIGQFAIPGECVDVQPFRRGHIHDTYVSTWVDGGQRQRYLHQRLNDAVFRDIGALMHNIERVTEHLRRKNGEGVHTLTLVPTRDGSHYLSGSGRPWRTFVFLENTESFDLCRDERQAYEAASAFGRFQDQLTDLDVDGLAETIPHFFSSPLRMQQLESAVRADRAGRADGAAAEIRFALARKEMVGVIDELQRAGTIPVRIVHGDTKLNNVLFDTETGRAVCIVDLDTCMPGYSLYDFGDLVRFTAATSAEDERDLDRVGTDLDLYRALVAGYRETAGFMSRKEQELMPFAARLVTFTIGLRFLADHLAGDVYFKVSRPDHNLDRARVQFRMVQRMEHRAEQMAIR